MAARTVHEILTPGEMTIFPQASVHMMMNLGCENAYTISELGGSTSSPGLSQLVIGHCSRKWAMRLTLTIAHPKMMVSPSI